MQARITDRPVEQMLARIQALDLDPIKFKLMDPEEGQGWSREYTDRMEVAYKQFLTLLATHPEETLAPSKDVDKFWHGHILDTLKYAEDCDSIFGCFVHHFPYFGMRGAEDAANLARAAETTQRLYEQEFGRGGAKTDKAAWCGAIKADKAAWCGAIKADKAAWCGAIKADKAAWCGAIKADKAAWCGAIKANKAAWCGAIKADKAAWCGAIRAEKPVALKEDKLNVAERPTL